LPLCAYPILIMATMTIRTTVAFDPATVARWERLTKRWGTSKSETLRRALEVADKDISLATAEVPDFTGMTPLQIVDWLTAHPSPKVPGGWGSDSQRELREMRERDAALEEARERGRGSSRARRLTRKDES